jgi:hypothetical protein
MIYLVKCGEYYKIGYTSGRTANERLNSMQTGNPYPMTLAGFWEGTRDHEAELHTHFATRRVSGEWFALTDEDVATVESIAKAIVTGERLIPETPKEPPRSKFPEGLNVPVEGCYCAGCASLVHFVGSLDYVVCEFCKCQLSQNLYLRSSRRDRREAMHAVVRAHKL